MTYTSTQHDFINSKEKFIRLLAPAGCGKTFCIAEKAKKLIEQNPKVRIAIFTFTKNAANEIKNRCNNDSCITVNTLNSWGNNYIKGILRNPRMIKQENQKFFVLNSLQPVWIKHEHCSKFEPLLTGRSRVHKSAELLDLIDEFKNIGFKHTMFNKKIKNDKEVYDQHLQFIKNTGLERYYSAIVQQIWRLIGPTKVKDLTLDDILNNSLDEEKHNLIIRHWIPFWYDCCDYMAKTGFYTFEDQKYISDVELSTKKQKWKGATKIDYIFIDEFQDTSPLDVSLISNLQKKNDANLIIVGDDDQSIFEFRGASPYFMLHPNKLFEHEFYTFILDENFRSPRNIVNKSILLIKNNKNRVEKNVKSSSDLKEANIRLLEYESQKEMIDAVINDVKETSQNKTIAILSRLKSSLLPYQILLTKENISYFVSDDLAFFYTTAASDLDKAIDIKQKSSWNADDYAELVYLFTKNKMYNDARSKLLAAFQANSVCSSEKTSKVMLLLGDKLPQFQRLFTVEYIADFIATLEKFQKASNVYETLDVLLHQFGGFQQNYSRSLEDLYYKDPPLSSLLNFAEKYDSDFSTFTKDFHRAIDRARLAASDDTADIIIDDSNKRILLSTALRVKGQEFDKVIIIDTNDGIWPKLPRTVAEMEAERRLFYVATTRAKENMHLYRTSFIGEQDTKISPFIIEGTYNQ